MDVAPDVKQKPKIVKHYPGCLRELLCRCKYFEGEGSWLLKAFVYSVLNELFQVIMCLDGEGQIEVMDKNLKPVSFVKGRTLFLPVGLVRRLVVGDADFLKIKC